jgi:hypothetical protein
MIAEYWADGPTLSFRPGTGTCSRSSSPAATTTVFTSTGSSGTSSSSSRSPTQSDAGCCAWDSKRAFDSVRPITAIRILFRGWPVRAWAGPYQGTKLIDGAAWFPYQPTTFPTPPFPEYSSGHSNFSAADAEILRLFTHNDRFGGSVTLPAGSSRVEPAAVPASDLTLSWATFSEAANQAGISRRYGGIHFEQGDLDARATGRIAARIAWRKPGTTGTRTDCQPGRRAGSIASLVAARAVAGRPAPPPAHPGPPAPAPECRTQPPDSPPLRGSAHPARTTVVGHWSAIPWNRGHLRIVDSCNFALF